ncbi:hypothetical protein KFK09_028092 [Dendrobium nobile]|uniref:Uncharacterized protein n=1 Tax=Dendrobium nobile TaxID=94219 RepID=A0A8T3A0S2_DENNO|nr:hypothetical protein KFK09_028092 [Dendrobium nobile]
MTGVSVQKSNDERRRRAEIEGMLGERRRHGCGEIDEDRDDSRANDKLGPSCPLTQPSCPLPQPALPAPRSRNFHCLEPPAGPAPRPAYPTVTDSRVASPGEERRRPCRAFFTPRPRVARRQARSGGGLAAPFSRRVRASPGEERRRPAKSSGGEAVLRKVQRRPGFRGFLVCRRRTFIANIRYLDGPQSAKQSKAAAPTSALPPTCGLRSLL